MSLKSKILCNLLTKGGALTAKELSDGTVSRNAVWKAVRSLQEEGYPVRAIAGKGYALTEGADFPHAQEIERLCDRAFCVEVVWETESTNTLLRRRAEEGAPHGTVLIACRQSGGRGRMGRSFFSDSGGLYMSLLLRPDTDAAHGGDITGLAAVAVAEAIEAISEKRAYIKWVNDVFCEGKKVCGILTEAAVALEGGALDYAVVGIGLNVYSPRGGFPEGLEGIAGGLYQRREGTAGLINRYAAEILRRFDDLYRHPATALKSYKERCFVIGQTVTALRGGEEAAVKVLDVADDYSLLVKGEDGEKRLINSGEVRIRPEGIPK